MNHFDLLRRFPRKPEGIAFFFTFATRRQFGSTGPRARDLGLNKSTMKLNWRIAGEKETRKRMTAPMLQKLTGLVGPAEAGGG